MQFFLYMFFAFVGIAVNFLCRKNEDVERACRNAHKELVAYEKCVKETSWSDTTVVLKSSLNKGD